MAHQMGLWDCSPSPPFNCRRCLLVPLERERGVPGASLPGQAILSPFSSLLFSCPPPPPPPPNPNSSHLPPLFRPSDLLPSPTPTRRSRPNLDQTLTTFTHPLHTPPETSFPIVSHTQDPHKVKADRPPFPPTQPIFIHTCCLPRPLPSENPNHHGFRSTPPPLNTYEEVLLAWNVLFNRFLRPSFICQLSHLWFYFNLSALLFFPLRRREIKEKNPNPNPSDTRDRKSGKINSRINREISKRADTRTQEARSERKTERKRKRKEKKRTSTPRRGLLMNEENGRECPQ